MTLSDRINDIKGRPHHEKKRVVFGVATLCTAFVAVIWLGASLATNSFAVTLPAPAASGVEAAPRGAAAAQYAGAAAALTPPSAHQQASGIEIISTATSSTLSKGRSGQTIIPF
ncbi:MAG TPA: hypothetical protein VMT80_02575 [Candidatus Paceibacterota bacterium]|nr:hypothetical protein [Candidatus Paceibacterota bacterium]